LIVLDTNPCIQSYINDDPLFWDPCGTLYPTCSIDGGSDDFEGECHFHENILKENCSEQYYWFKDKLAGIKEEELLIVIGHHPSYQINNMPFYDLIADSKVDLYLNGHTHLLNHYSVNGVSKYVTTGAGAMVSVGSMNSLNSLNEPQQIKLNSSISHDVKWSQKIAGFTSHTIYVNNNTLTTNYIDYNGNTVYAFTIPY